MLDWEGLRRAEFGEVTRRWAFLDHAAVSPLPKRAADGVREYADRQQMNGVLEAGEWERTIAAARGSARALIAAEDGEVALTTSTTAGVNIIAEGFPWQAGDVVVT
ncbi:MAG: aminotransferase class V-fold PLP-dependent enzyme, partial [Planctomycetota bacterium]|nr:aminotransferase class V-fold PLP-dependent enzyme [Planctomycetota bacterium]